MTDMEQALAISGGIFALMLASQYGRRRYTLHKVLTPFVTVGVIGWFYLKDMPTSRVEWVVYTVGAVIGGGCGVIATVTTAVEHDPGGAVYTRCGAGFVATWLAVVLSRIAFVFAADHVGWFRDDLGQFLHDNAIAVGAIPPFFVIMALAMVIARVVLLRLRISSAAVAEDAYAVATS